MEGAVYEAGLQSIESGQPALLHFGVADETAFSVGLACGGNIEVFVRKLDPALFETIQTEIQAGKAAAIVTALSGPPGVPGREMLCLAENRFSGSLGPSRDGIARELARERLEQGLSGSVTVAEVGGDPVRLFIDVISPPPVLVLVGGVHIAVSLAALAKTLGYTTVVIDPRRAFGSQERFPHVDHLIQAWPDKAFQQIPLLRTTAVAVLTHDPKIDDPALMIVLNSPAFYIGVLGSQLFSEWQTTEEAKQTYKTFSETVTFPFPKKSVVVKFYGHNRKNELLNNFEFRIDPENYFIIPERVAEYKNFEVLNSGNPSVKVDIVIIPEGYTEDEMEKFKKDCEKFAGYLFNSSPFKENKEKFNIWGIEALSLESGVDIPKEDIWKKTVVNSAFYTFDLERYLMTSDNKSLRNVGSNAPYDP